MSKKQLLSSQTVLLQGGGRTNIEYSAGDNINITNDVISGRDWSDIIDDRIESAMSGIPSQVEYSAGDNINITDHVVSGRDWTPEISAASANASAAVPWISGSKEYDTIYMEWGHAYPAFSSFDLSGYKNHKIHMKGAYYVLPSIESAISSKLDLSAFNSFIDNSYTPNIAQLFNSAAYLQVNKLDISAIQGDSATSSITAINGSAISGAGASAGCIWISGAKDYDGETLQMEAGTVIPILSGWDLSGDHNHSLCMKGRYIRMPDSAAFFTRDEWNNFYSAGWSPNINTLYSSAAYLDANKLDISAFTAYSAAHSGDDNTPYSGASGIKVENHLISITGDVGKTYSAGANINITDEVVSGKDWTAEINAATSSVSSKLDTSSFTAYSASHSGDDNTAYSAGQNINVTNHVISGKDWTDEINNKVQSATSGKLDSSAYHNYSAGANVDITNYVVSGKDWSGEINAATSGKLDTSATTNWDKTAYSAGDNINVSNHVISGKDWSGDIEAATSGKADKSEIPTIVDYSAGTNINITNHVVSGKDWTSEISAASAAAVAAASGIEYSAGANINVTDHVISGKDWTSDINAATSGKLDSSATTNWDNQAYSAGDNINISNHVVSGKDWTAEINAATSGKLNTSSFTAYSAAHSGDDNQAYSGGNNIKVENHIISVTGQMGKVYSGITPIQVDNTNDTIGLDMDANYTFVPGTNIEFEEDEDEKTVTINSTYSYDPTSAISGKADTSALSGKADKSQLSAFVPYSSFLAVSDGTNNCIQAIKNVNTNEYYHISGDWAYSSTRSLMAKTDERNRDLSAAVMSGDLSAYIPFSSIDGDSTTSSISAINGSAVGGGSKIDYRFYNPQTTVSADGDLHIVRNTGATTPDKTKVIVNETEVGLLAPIGTVPAGMLVTNAMGGVSWQPQSALIPKDASAYAGYYTKALSYGDDIDWVLTAHPTYDHDWVLDVYNDTYGANTARFYFSGGNATGTIDPGEGVRMHYNYEEDYLFAEPIYTVGDGGYGDYYARCNADLDGVRIRVTGSSAGLPSNDDILYIVTGSN